MKPLHILLVEDNEGDILLTRVALEDAGINFKLSVVGDGKEAIDFLNKEGNFSDASTPELLLLDINLPKKNGHEVLIFIKGIESLKHIPVIMLTTSSAEKDIKLAQTNHADNFITKPSDVNEFLKIVAQTINYWIPVIRNNK